MTDFRKATAQIGRGAFNARQASFLFTELVVIALCAGGATKSWYWGGGTFLALTASLAIKPLRILLILILSAGWGALGYLVGLGVGKEAAAGVVCGGIASIVALGCHLAATEWLRDYSRD